MITFPTALTDGTTLKIRVKNEPSSEWLDTITVDTLDPVAPTYAESSSVVTVTGEALADIYLVLDDSGTSAGSTKVDVIDQIGTNDTTALQNLLALDTHQWARGTIAAGGTTGTIDTSGLMDGSYNLYQVDQAGNFSPVSTDGAVTVSGSSVTDNSAATYEYDVMFASLDNGTDGLFSDASSDAVATQGEKDAVVQIDLNDVAENDIVELYVDGQLIFSKEVTAADKSSGSITTTSLDFDTKDIASGTETVAMDPANDQVTLELKVKHQGIYVQEGREVTWDYYW
jgi:hypothetical protein